MSGGVGAGLDAAMKAAAEDEQAEGLAEVVQAGLFEDLDETETGSLSAPSPLSGALAKPRGGPGRPKGSKNRRTEAVSAWLLQQHRHPLSVMMEAYSMTPAQLAERIGLAKSPRKVKSLHMVDGAPVEIESEEEGDRYSNDVLLDILKLQVRMAEAVAPYVAQKLPQAHQIESKAGVVVQFAGVSFPARGQGAGNSEAIEGEVMGVRLPFKSDGPSRTDAEATDNVEVSP